MGRMRGGGAMRGQNGFTLIELLITMVILGIIMAIAIPSYGRYQARNHRSVAQAALMEIAQRQPQFLIDNRAYADDPLALSIVVSPEVLKYYDITIVPQAGPPPTYVATATPKAGTSQATDGPMSIDQAGTKQPPGRW
jgi:type IV pilus assembly protein PilE